MVNWYDPIDGRWYKMPEPPKPEKAEIQVPHVEDIYVAAEKTNRIRRTWEAIVSTSTATQMSSEPDDKQESS